MHNLIELPPWDRLLKRIKNLVVAVEPSEKKPSNRKEIKPLENKLKMVSYHLSKGKITIFNMQES